MYVRLLFGGVAAIAIAWLAWGSPGLTLFALFALPVWAIAARNRASLFLLAWLYYAVSMIELIEIPQHYFTVGLSAGLALGVLAWLTWSGLLAGFCALGWHSNARYRIWLIPLVALAINLPPVGWFSIASPWVATGYWFSGYAWWGLIAAIVMCVAIGGVMMTKPNQRLEFWTYSATLCVCIALIGGSHSPNNEIRRLQGIQAMQTHWGETRLDSQSQYTRIQQFARMEASIDKSAALVVWPETALGQWSPRTAYWLLEHPLTLPAPGQTWIVGAAQKRDGIWVNGYLIWKAELPPIFNDGRIPMPVGMWRPGGFKSAPWAKSVVTINDHKIGVSICYEDLLPWAAWQLHFERVDRVVSLSSMWFAKDLNLNRNAAQSAKGWAMLFGVPYARSVNF